MPSQASINPGIRPRTISPSWLKRHRSVLFGGLLILLYGCATTPPVSPEDEARTQAKIAYLLNDYQRTLAIVLPRADAGEAWAQYTLGYLYYYGRGIAQDRETGKRWIESAAAKGYAPAQLAMQHLATSPPKSDDENKAMSEQEPAARSTAPAPQTGPAASTEPAPPSSNTPPMPNATVVPTEQTDSAQPQMTAPSSNQAPETREPVPELKPSTAPETTTIPSSQDTSPLPGMPSDQPTDTTSPAPSHDSPQTSDEPSPAAAGDQTTSDSP